MQHYRPREPLVPPSCYILLISAMVLISTYLALMLYSDEPRSTRVYIAEDVQNPTAESPSRVSPSRISG